MAAEVHILMEKSASSPQTTAWCSRCSSTLLPTCVLHFYGRPRASSTPR